MQKSLRIMNPRSARIPMAHSIFPRFGVTDVHERMKIRFECLISPLKSLQRLYDLMPGQILGWCVHNFSIRQNY